MSECIHEMAPGTCSYCKPKPAKEVLHVWVTATFPGECYECLGDIVEGDLIAHNDHGWVSTCCARPPSAEDDFA